MELSIQRIRYVKQENGLLVSKPMLGKEHIVTVTIQPANMKFQLHNKLGLLLTEGTAKTIPLLKSAAKAALKSAGVLFLDEVRERKDKSSETKEEGV